MPLPGCRVYQNRHCVCPEANTVPGRINRLPLKIGIWRRQDGGYTLALSDHLEHFPGADSFRYLFKFRRWKRTRTALFPKKGLLSPR